MLRGGYGEQAMGYESGARANDNPHGRDKPVEVDRRSEVERALDAQSGAIDRLGSALGELCSRLTPVLYDAPPEKDGALATEPMGTGIGRAINGRTDQVRILADQVERLICRLGI